MRHTFFSHLEWTGATKGSTLDAATFSRDLDITIGARTLPMSSASGFRGDPERLNPEQLLVASVSACQALTYLFLAARRSVTVVAYSDDAEGHLEIVEGKMRMSRVVLRPRITLGADAPDTTARELIDRAHTDCFIANSITATVDIEPIFQRAATLAGQP
jgi:organic hydroperoxide reductase OsmC/OhrA